VFTGLIQDIGVIEATTRDAESVRFEIRTALADRLRDGDSLAVNGVCLTVVAGSRAGRLFATAVAETLDRSTLGALERGGKVHLECALCAGDPMGGHIVQGHVDGVGRVAQIEKRGQSIELSVEIDPGLERYLAAKGSVTLEGASLTVARLSEGRFTVALVPHTLEHTLFGQARVGQSVNVEVDILAKYVERMLEHRHGPAKPTKLTEAWLKDQGY